MSKDDRLSLKLTSQEANAIMMMLDSDMEKTFDEGIDPIADWETLHFYAYQMLAYQAFKMAYVEKYG